MIASTNTPAYLASSTVTKEKCFITFTPGDNLIKLFSLSLMKGPEIVFKPFQTGLIFLGEAMPEAQRHLKGLKVTLSIMTLSITTLCRYAEFRYAEFRVLSIVRLNVSMLGVVLLNVAMLSLAMLNVIMLNVAILSLAMLNVVIAECRYADCRYAECHYAECRYAECHYAECRGDMPERCYTRVRSCHTCKY